MSRLADLNFPPIINARYKNNSKGILQVFDVIRKKFVDLTPEEWVRQHMIHFFIEHKQVPASLISVEKQLILNQTKKRTDMVIFNTGREPLMIVECKAPEITIDQSTINQALRYNLQLNVPYICISNGLSHICIRITEGVPANLGDFPDFPEMLKN